MADWPPPADCCGLCCEKLEDGLGTGIQFPLGGVPSGAAHQECMLRSALGGIGHLEDHAYWCQGPGQDTNGGRSYRQSALEVAIWVKEHSIEEAVNIG